MSSAVIPKHETVVCRCGHSKTEHSPDCRHEYVRTGIKIGQWADTRETTFCDCPSFVESPHPMSQPRWFRTLKAGDTLNCNGTLRRIATVHRREDGSLFAVTLPRLKPDTYNPPRHPNWPETATVVYFANDIKYLGWVAPPR